jgi:hypothetical protein
VLVMQEDACVMLQHPAHDAEASASHAAPNIAVAQPEQGLRHAVTPPAHFDEAHAEHAL